MPPYRHDAFGHYALRRILRHGGAQARALTLRARPPAQVRFSIRQEPAISYRDTHFLFIVQKAAFFLRFHYAIFIEIEIIAGA